MNVHTPVLRFVVPADHDLGRAVWPMTVPAVTQVIDEGFEPSPGVTLLVGENGAGKSTLVEAFAEAYGLGPEGGTPFGSQSTRRSESALASALRLHRGPAASRYGFFLRAETMHGWFTYVEELGGTKDPRYHEMSHGESFLEVLRSRIDTGGFYCLDEPEAALSFTSQLALMAAMHDLAAAGGQIVCATHSPVLAALPGARIVEVGPWGLRDATWEELELVANWRNFLDAPDRYLRHLLA